MGRLVNGINDRDTPSPRVGQKSLIPFGKRRSQEPRTQVAGRFELADAAQESAAVPVCGGSSVNELGEGPNLDSGGFAPNNVVAVDDCSDAHGVMIVV